MNKQRRDSWVTQFLNKSYDGCNGMNTLLIPFLRSLGCFWKAAISRYVLPRQWFETTFIYQTHLSNTINISRRQIYLYLLNEPTNKAGSWFSISTGGFLLNFWVNLSVIDVYSISAQTLIMNNNPTIRATPT